jgi:hypothetical protein
MVMIHRGTPMAVELQGSALPQGATVAIRIEMTVQANITPFVAQQQVTRVVVTEISSQLRGTTPDLHVGERLCWSVSVVLTSPNRAVVGRVVPNGWLNVRPSGAMPGFVSVRQQRLRFARRRRLVRAFRWVNACTRSLIVPAPARPTRVLGALGKT